jgi:hypothetical protein
MFVDVYPVLSRGYVVVFGGEGSGHGVICKCEISRLTDAGKIFEEKFCSSNSFQERTLQDFRDKLRCAAACSGQVLSKWNWAIIRRTAA